MRILFLCLIWILPVASQGQFIWPSNVASNGPYTLYPTVSNYMVLSLDTNNPVSENDLATHKYRNHTRTAWFQGMIAVAYSSAATNEGAGGQQTGISFSWDRGATWSAPVQACPSQSQWTDTQSLVPSRITYPRNFQTTNGNLYLIVAVDQEVISSTTAVQAQGDALFVCQVFTNGTLSSLSRISTNTFNSMDGKTVPPYDSTLRGLCMEYSKTFGTWGGSYPDAWVTNSEWLGWIFHTYVFVEPNTFPSDTTGTNLIRIWRKDTSVWQQQSTNSGNSWSLPVMVTGIPNDPSETTGLRLSDGRFVIVGNPQATGSKHRDPLFLAITDTASQTITNVWALRQGLTNASVYPGVGGKFGGAQYPGAVQAGNHLFVSYSVAKETIQVSDVRIPDTTGPDDYGWPPPVTISVGTATIGTLRTAP